MAQMAHCASASGANLTALCGLGPLSDSPGLVYIHNPVTKLDHAKREIVAASFCEIPRPLLWVSPQEKIEKCFSNSELDTARGG